MKRSLFLLFVLGLLMSAMSAELKPGRPSGRAQAAAKTLTPAQRIKLLDLLNAGDEKVLQTLPGIGEIRAAAIKKARPILEPVQLLEVVGIGDQTLVDIVAHVRAGFPGTSPAQSKTAKKKAPAKSK